VLSMTNGSLSEQVETLEELIALHKSFFVDAEEDEVLLSALWNGYMAVVDQQLQELVQRLDGRRDAAEKCLDDPALPRNEEIAARGIAMDIDARRWRIEKARRRHVQLCARLVRLWDAPQLNLSLLDL